MSTQHPHPAGAQANAQALAVFDEFQSLLEGRDLPDFWPRYASVCRLLLRSPAVLCLAVTPQAIVQQENCPQETRLLAQARADQASPADDEQMQHQALAMVDRLSAKGFVFEPLDVDCPELDDAFLLLFEVTGQDQDDDLCYLVAALVEHANVTAFNDLVVRSQLIRHAWRCAQTASASSTQAAAEFAVDQHRESTQSLSDQDLVYTLSVLERVSAKDGYVLACMTLVDELAAHFNCSKVALGQIQGDYLHLVAISHVESFDRNSDAIKELEFLQEEAVDQWHTLTVPASGDERLIRASHDKYCRSQALSQVVSIPFGGADDDQSDERETFCLTLECTEGALSERQQLLLEVLLNQLTPWLSHRHYQDLWGPQKLLRRVRRFGRWWLGPNNTLIKLIAVSSSVALILAALIPVDYRIEAVANLETDNIAFMSAPFNGFVREVALQPGDQVTQGQLLLRLDTEELELKALQEEANRVRFAREAEKSRARRKLVDMKVALARKVQAEAELSRVQYYLDRAELRAPFDGILVEGEREELLGAPVDKGDLLMKVANPVGLYARVKLPERDIDEVASGALASLKLLSRPDQTFDFVVDRIVPQATVDASDGNVFVVRANSTVKTVPDWWRPGMSGVIHIDAGERSLLWIALHRTLDAIRMKLWI